MAALADRPRPRLEHLSIGYGFEDLYENNETSAGSPIDPLDYLHRGITRTAPWDALPALRSLEAEGPFLFDAVDHAGLTRLRVRGPVVSDGALFDLGRTPAVVSLEVEVGCDVFGVTCPLDQLDELQAAQFPALRELDLGDAEFDAGSIETLAALAASTVLPRLERLTVRDLVVGRHACEGEPLAALAELAPRFAHLALHVRGTVAVEGATAEDVARVLPALRAGTPGTPGTSGSPDAPDAPGERPDA
ncbi:hypothetical protein ACWGB8_38355 [Kitasatospora sp. NPDC054939]